MFKKYGIKTFDTSFDRYDVLNYIVNNLDNIESKNINGVNQNERRKRFI